MIFEKLPQLEKCCCCFSLKWGSVAIGVVFLLEGCRVAVFGFLLSPQDKVCHDGINHAECPLREAWTCLSYTVLCLKFVIFFSAVFLLVGALIANRWLITAFLYCLALGEVLLFLVSTFVFLAAVAVPVCGIKDENDVAFCTILGFARLILRETIYHSAGLLSVCAYVLVVAKSLRCKIDRRRRRPVVRISDTCETVHLPPPSAPEKESSLSEIEPDAMSRRPSLRKSGTPPRKLEFGFENIA